MLDFDFKIASIFINNFNAADNDAADYRVLLGALLDGNRRSKIANK